MDSSSQPSEDAFSRVSNPERFQALQEVALSIVEELEDQYDVVRQEGTHLDSEVVHLKGACRVMRLEPSDSRAAPLTFGLGEPFGLTVRFGAWTIVQYPSCFCDACDEDPDELAGSLRGAVEGVVEGVFRERLHWLLSPGLSSSLSTRTRWSRMSRSKVSRLGSPGRKEWKPWPPR